MGRPKKNQGDIILTLPKERDITPSVPRKIIIPPVPVRMPGENVFDFAHRKNEWKVKYFR